MGFSLGGRHRVISRGISHQLCPSSLLNVMQQNGPVVLSLGVFNGNKMEEHHVVR
jgi:hypothetical protein